MSFKDFTTINEAANRFDITVHRQELIDYTKIAAVSMENFILDRLKFDLAHHPSAPEVSLVVIAIYPILREVWLRHPTLQIWQEILLKADDVLSGMPDFLIAKPSPRGLRELVSPVMAVVEAKREDFDMGWGQCLAELVAAQRFNGERGPKVIYGIVTTGELWQFGKLDSQNLTIDLVSLSLFPRPEILLGVLDHLFILCEQELAIADKN